MKRFVSTTSLTIVEPYYMGVTSPDNSPLSALPSSTARILAFTAICVGGAAGGLIGYALADIQCTGDCGLPLGLGIFIGSVVSAAGTAVVSVLVLRALGEWRELASR
jgi:hypothetical protein